MSSNKYAITIDNVSKCYEMYEKPTDRLKQFFSKSEAKYYKEFWALKNISFSIKKGEVVGILGRNGSGKSTLLQIIANTLQPTSGEVKAEGTLAALLELGSGFNPEFTGHDNIYLNGAILGLSKADIDHRYDEIVAFADIGEHLFQPVKTYSSGMAIRLAFAVQACVHPQILIVDEALSVGDEKFQRKCFNYIDKLKDDGCSILLVTHSTATVEKFCQRGILLNKGILHAEGKAKDIVDQYHALLYTDEKAYYKRLGHPDAPKAQPKKLSTNEVPADDYQGQRAVIESCTVLDIHNENCEYYATGETIVVHIDVKFYDEVNETQAGILLRTVEGVSAFGTSSLYHNQNYLMAKVGQRIRFSFTMDLQLSPGTYFVTCSIAEAITSGDMVYLDRKTDVSTIKVATLNSISGGIAFLPTQISVEEL